MNWEKYWSDKTISEHRYQDENYFRKKALEQLLHLQGGQTLLDFACGAAEINAYVVGQYKQVLCVDFSHTMLEEARKRLTNVCHFSHIHFLCGNEGTLWNQLNQKFDRISAANVVQYMDKKQIETFLSNACCYLNDGGKIILFDIVDPRTYFLWEYGLFKKKERRRWQITLSYLKSSIKQKVRKIRELPESELGNLYHPLEIQEIAQKYNLSMEFVWSVYNEYRYHVILTQSACTG